MTASSNNEHEYEDMRSRAHSPGAFNPEDMDQITCTHCDYKNQRSPSLIAQSSDMIVCKKCGRIIPNVIDDVSPEESGDE
jgi:DNA-directed RNA polymerase subunit RPC12/RpoP